MSELTKGRWTVENWSDKEAQVVAKHCGKKALICAGVMPPDAHLIAAAPDLYEALEAAMSALNKHAEDAFAKARGEAQ